MRGSLEAELLEVLWALGRPASVREVLERVNAGREAPLAYTTVMTVLSRLATKGHALRQPEGRAYLYQAAGNDEAAIAVEGVLRTHGDAAVAHFVSHAEADPELRERLRRILSEQAPGDA